MLIDGEFSMNADRGLLNPKYENVNIQYVKSILEPKLREIAKGRKGEKGEDEFTKVYPSMIKNVEIEMFVNEKGVFDIAKQNEIAEKYEYIAELKAKIEDYKKQIEELNVEIENECQNSIQHNVSLLFQLKSVPRKLFIKDIQEKGNIPVYSSQIENNGMIKYSNIEMFNASRENPLITFGDHTRIFYLRTAPFAVLDNVKVLALKQEYKNKVNLEYILHLWHLKIENVGYSRYWKHAKEVEISIPINSKGEFDLSAQKEIAEKCQKIEQIKKSISEELDKIAKIEIEFE